MTFDEKTNTYTTSNGTRLTREEAEEIYNFIEFEYICGHVRTEASHLYIDLTEDQIEQIANGVRNGDVLREHYFTVYCECLVDAILEMKKESE